MQDKTNYKTNLKINYNKSIKDKEKKILEYYKRKSNLEANKNQLPKLKKRTKKYIPNTDKNINMQETDQKINDSTKSEIFPEKVLLTFLFISATDSAEIKCIFICIEWELQIGYFRKICAELFVGFKTKHIVFELCSNGYQHKIKVKFKF